MGGNKKSREEFLSRMHYGFLEFRGPAMTCPYFLFHAAHGTLATAHLTSVLEALA